MHSGKHRRDNLGHLLGTLQISSFDNLMDWIVIVLQLLRLVFASKYIVSFVFCICDFLVSVASLLEMANTIRFGTSCGPQATASAGRAGVVEEVVEEFGKDYLNPFVKMFM